MYEYTGIYFVMTLPYLLVNFVIVAVFSYILIFILYYLFVVSYGICCHPRE